mgnify:CR=1 FL=1
MTHTPTPWKFAQESIDPEWAIVTDADGNIIANVNSETGPDIPPLVSTKMPRDANAAHIVHCVNNHDALLQALKALVREIDLSKLNVRKDFSLLNAHAYATKTLAQAEGK